MTHGTFKKQLLLSANVAEASRPDARLIGSQPFEKCDSRFLKKKCHFRAECSIGFSITTLKIQRGSCQLTDDCIILAIGLKLRRGLDRGTYLLLAVSAKQDHQDQQQDEAHAHDKQGEVGHHGND